MVGVLHNTTQKQIKTKKGTLLQNCLNSCYVFVIIVSHRNIEVTIKGQFVQQQKKLSLRGVITLYLLNLVYVARQL